MIAYETGACNILNIFGEMFEIFIFLVKSHLPAGTGPSVVECLERQRINVNISSRIALAWDTQRDIFKLV